MFTCMLCNTSCIWYKIWKFRFLMNFFIFVLSQLFSNTAVAPCRESEFSCSDGRCIQRYQVCDNRMDCSDGLDEENCRRKWIRKVLRYISYTTLVVSSLFNLVYLYAKKTKKIHLSVQYIIHKQRFNVSGVRHHKAFRFYEISFEIKFRILFNTVYWNYGNKPLIKYSNINFFFQTIFLLSFYLPVCNIKSIQNINLTYRQFNLFPPKFVTLVFSSILQTILFLSNLHICLSLRNQIWVLFCLLEIIIFFVIFTTSLFTHSTIPRNILR